jgi:competence protein ComEC
VLPWIAGGWLLGLLLGAQWQSELRSVLLAAAIIGALVLGLYGRELRARLWCGVLGVLACLCGLGVPEVREPPCSEAGLIHALARVESARYRREDVALRLRLQNGQRLEARTSFDATPPLGSVVAVRAQLRPRTTLRNPSPHPPLLPTRVRSCWARVQSARVLRLHPIRRRIHALGARIREHLRGTLDPDTAAVARALVLGDGGALAYDQRKTIAAVGLAHLFAVSGLHVALVSGTLVACLRWLLAGCAIGFDARRLAAALGVPLTLLHAAFAGGAPSAWRAAMTAAITWGLIATGRRPSAPAITAIAALALSGQDPKMALRPAFLLSIVATAAILSAPRRHDRSGWLRSSATISARTVIATAPMVWWWFGGVPLVGWLTNIVVLPLGSWVVIPLAHLYALSSWAPDFAQLPGALLSASVELLLRACEVFSPLAIAKRLPPLDPAQGAIVTLASVGLLVADRWRARLIILVGAGLLWAAAEAALLTREQPHGELRVTFVDVGQGDAALLDFPNGRFALIDTGRGGEHPAARELRQLLAARRRSRIDLVVLTHGHPDHFGGLADLFEEVAIGEIWLNAQLLREERDGAMEALLNRALRARVTLRFAPELCGTIHDFGGARVEPLWPCPRYDPGLALNDNSIVLRVIYGERSFLFTGDIESDAERRLIDIGMVPQVDVLKVAHHGSRTSSTPGFLHAANPELAVVSSGTGNRYGHPSPEVLRRLRAIGAAIWRTDIQGGLIVRTDGSRLELAH